MNKLEFGEVMRALKVKLVDVFRKHTSFAAACRNSKESAFVAGLVWSSECLSSTIYKC